MVKKTIKYIIVLLFVVTYFSADPIGYSLDSGFVSHLLYSFFHANIIHLVVNAVAIFSMIKILEKVIHPIKAILSSFVIAVICSFVAEQSLPTIGASGLCFALIGIDFGLRWCARYFPISIKKMEVYSLSIFGGMLVQFFFPIINIKLHLLCFLAGVVVSYFLVKPKRLMVVGDTIYQVTKIQKVSGKKRRYR